MGNIECDECGTTPYCTASTETDVKLKVWCDCPDQAGIPAVIKPRFDKKSPPESWGEADDRYLCYQCGADIRMRTSVSGGGVHPKTNYNATCRCEHTIYRFGWRGPMPDRWKDDMDITKWPELYDEIQEALEEEGPMDRKELGEYLDQTEECIQCVTIHMQRDDELYGRNSETDKLLTPDQMIERDIIDPVLNDDETSSAPNQDEGSESKGLAERFKDWMRPVFNPFH